MYFDIEYDDEKFVDLVIRPQEHESADLLHEYANRLIIRNPAIDFSNLARAGKFNNMTDEDYETVLNRIKAVNLFFKKNPSANVFQVLNEAIRYILSHAES